MWVKHVVLLYTAALRAAVPELTMIRCSTVKCVFGSISSGVLEEKEWFCFKNVLGVGEFSQDYGSISLFWDS